MVVSVAQTPASQVELMCMQSFALDVLPGLTDAAMWIFRSGTFRPDVRHKHEPCRLPCSCLTPHSRRSIGSDCFVRAVEGGHAASEKRCRLEKHLAACTSHAMNLSRVRFTCVVVFCCQSRDARFSRRDDVLEMDVHLREVGLRDTSIGTSFVLSFAGQGRHACFER